MSGGSLRFSRFLCPFVWFQVGLLSSTSLIIGDGCCSDALAYVDDFMYVYCNKLNYNKFCRALIRGGGEDGDASSTRASVCSRR